MPDLNQETGPKRIGDNIRALRIKRGISQEELAEALNVSQSMVSAIESGDRTDILASTVRRFATALGCGDEDITEGAEFPLSKAEATMIKSHEK